jgi:Gas vesicle protein
MTAPARSVQAGTSLAPSNLGDILERVLDKGIVIAGDISVAVGGVELLSIKIRLIIASVERAQAMGIDWWNSDPSLSSGRRGENGVLENENIKLKLELENAHLKAELARVKFETRALLGAAADD